MKQEIERIAPQLVAVGQNVDEIMRKFVKTRRARRRPPADISLSLLADQGHRQRSRPCRCSRSRRKRNGSSGRQDGGEGHRQNAPDRSRLRDLRDRRSGRCVARVAVFTGRVRDQPGKACRRSQSRGLSAVRSGNQESARRHFCRRLVAQRQRRPGRRRQARRRARHESRKRNTSQAKRAFRAATWKRKSKR